MANHHPRTYSVSAGAKEPLYQFVKESLEARGARVLHSSPSNEAPLRLTFELPSGERAGIVAYLFFSNSRPTLNRPSDEHRFQVKYGTKDGCFHDLWQDPTGLYTTLLCGIDPERGLFVGADPVLHSPTRFFISVEYKDSHVAKILNHGWCAWERDRRIGDDPIEVLVGGRKNDFLKYIQFERASAGESQGHRHLLAEKSPAAEEIHGFGLRLNPEIPKDRIHSLAKEFCLSPSEVFDLIANARRLKMAVRGWVAEEHLVRVLKQIPDVTDCLRRDEEGAADVSLLYRNVPLTVECKNVLRVSDAQGRARVDFQRTRASKSDPCSRFYSTRDFDVLAACMNAVSETWSYRFVPTFCLPPHSKCPGKLTNLLRVDGGWHEDARVVLEEVAQRKASS